MSIFAGARKCCLKILAEELVETVSDSNGSERKNTRNGREMMKWNLSCKKYALEQKKFFNEWVNGVKADLFEKLSDLIITDQLKRKVSQEVKDHLIDDWSKLNSPDDLLEKLEEYETLRSTFRSKQPRKE
ncbi:hypothetical protein AVEN_59941-1 [Araneus ventricosus]|uniref:Uncharacterized protein n=1 Tax=Araneus ventricosus TaxID=182803 RepID=A0A4Y2CPP6_ARAVE|nr:hypothetical protein AVEN_59941-1 [Araneus ventricosus]